MGFALSPITLSSDSFAANGPIPKRCSAEGEDVSPQLRWSNAPAGTESFALVCHDPDAPLASAGSYGFVHWVLYNLPATLTELAEGASAGTEGVSDFGKPGYGGPLPPPGHGVHHYFFILIALDKALDLEPGLNLWELMSKVEPHVIGMNRLMGTYQR
ncbi:MAG: YbhB/YbcL family Raf kinase inhibitor-like protein [Azonexus sp.]|nr:YbhB/YbcL family Raf kinase inhibitor-like protein [Azonexus sp.]